jgi:predicted Zn-dependent peptidase
MKKARLLVFLLVGAVVAEWPSASSSKSTGTVRDGAPALEVEEHVLANGFRLLVVEDHRVPRVAASLWYRLGAIQEAQAEHGSTHFLEHAVHQGTTSVGTKDFRAEIPLLQEIAATERKLIENRNLKRNQLRERRVFRDELEWPVIEGEDELRRRLYALEDQDSEQREFWAEYNWYKRHGANTRHTDPVPATTWRESLEIDIDLPRENLELFFRLEADRMVNAVLRGWEAQRFTVYEQILNRASRPETGKFSEALDGVTGLAHPAYNSAGGHFRDFALYTREAMLRMYDDYFVPNNATLALVGDLTPAQGRELAERYFGRLRREAEPSARMDVEAEPPPAGSVRLDWQEPLSPRVVLRYRVPGVGHPDRPVIDTIAALLRGREGLLRSKVRGRSDSLGRAEFQVSGSRLGSTTSFDLVALPAGDEDLGSAERILMEAVEDLRSGKFDPRSLERARKSLRLGWEQTRSDRDELAYELGSFQVMDSWKTLLPFMEARESATVEDIRRVASRYFVPANQVVATARRKPS